MALHAYKTAVSVDSRLLCPNARIPTPRESTLLEADLENDPNVDITPECSQESFGQGTFPSFARTARPHSRDGALELAVLQVWRCRCRRCPSAAVLACWPWQLLCAAPAEQLADKEGWRACTQPIVQKRGDCSTACALGSIKPRRAGTKSGGCGCKERSLRCPTHSRSRRSRSWTCSTSLHCRAGPR
eukprot:COSAG03_NODE_165_length_11302_cov_262.544943_6_plen_187_part_00